MIRYFTICLYSESFFSVLAIGDMHSTAAYILLGHVYNMQLVLRNVTICNICFNSD